MKALFIILFLSSAAFAQENPWTNKNKVNPWGNQSKEVEKKDSVETKQEEPQVDSVLTIKNDILKDSLQTSVSPAKKDSFSVTVVQFDMNQPAPSEQQLIEDAQEQVSDEYRIGNDFAVGFTTGLFLNGFAFVPDLIYVIVDSKKEKEIQANIESDSTYTNVDDIELRTKTRNTIKTKKFFGTIGGLAVGSLTQIFLFVAIIAAF